MEARLRALVVLAALASLGANARSQHFLVTADSAELAQEVARLAEKYRRDLAIQWLGEPLGHWADPCPIRVMRARHAGGQTSFTFPPGGGHPRGWEMIVQGPRERILDSVLPHEILHTVFATHFQQPLPRWADEGACTTVEDYSERRKHDQLLIEFLTTEQGIPFNRMFKMTEYPQNILPLYSQGYSLARYLIAQGGKRKFVQYVGDGMASRNWTAATRQHYGFKSLSELQLTWVDWVGQGSPPLKAQPPAAELAVLTQDNSSAAPAVFEEEPARPSPASGKLSPVVPAAHVEEGSWYTRTAREAREQSAKPAANHGAVAAPTHSRARPPHFEAPRQIVLEWSRDNQRLRR